MFCVLFNMNIFQTETILYEHKISQQHQIGHLRLTSKSDQIRVRDMASFWVLLTFHCLFTNTELPGLNGALLQNSQMHLFKCTSSPMQKLQLTIVSHFNQSSPRQSLECTFYMDKLILSMSHIVPFTLNLTPDGPKHSMQCLCQHYETMLTL